MKPDLKLVGKPVQAASQPYDEAKGVRRIAILKAQLLAASVRYVREGQNGVLQDRVREASDWSGVPRTLIEVAVKRQP